MAAAGAARPGLGGRWLFDAKAGREEILFRRVGANELDAAIEVCYGFVEAQKGPTLTPTTTPECGGTP